MNVREQIRYFLMGKGCKIKGEAGIWYITGPDGQEWDMTIPFSKLDKAAMAAEEVAEATGATFTLGDTVIGERCPHGERVGNCDACDLQADFSYDAMREDRP